MLCQTTDERFGHMHTMIDSDEEPLVRGTVIDAGHSSVLLPDTESQAVLGSFGAGFSRQHAQQGDHVLPRVAPIQSADDDETQMLDALERDLTGPVVFPLSDGAEVDVAHVGRPRQSRRLVLILSATEWDPSISPGQVSFRECKRRKPSCQR